MSVGRCLNFDIALEESIRNWKKWSNHFMRATVLVKMYYADSADTGVLLLPYKVLGPNAVADFVAYSLLSFWRNQKLVPLWRSDWHESRRVFILGSCRSKQPHRSDANTSKTGINWIAGQCHRWVCLELQRQAMCNERTYILQNLIKKMKRRDYTRYTDRSSIICCSCVSMQLWGMST